MDINQTENHSNSPKLSSESPCLKNGGYYDSTGELTAGTGCFTCRYKYDG